MPDLKFKLERLLNDAADCQLLGALVTDPAKRDEYRQRAAQFALLAEQVMKQLGERPRSSDIDFLREQARACRNLAAGLPDATMTRSLLELAAELDARAAEDERRSPH